LSNVSGVDERLDADRRHNRRAGDCAARYVDHPDYALVICAEPSWDPRASTTFLLTWTAIVIRNALVFATAAILEIAGCFAFWTWLRRGAAPLVALLMNAVTNQAHF
jgi:hypothetical protein